MTEEVEVVGDGSDDGDDSHDDHNDEGSGAIGFDLGGLLAQAQSMQQHILDAQAGAASEVVEGQAGGGVVRVRVTGAFEFLAVEIDPEVVDPADPEMLQDLVLAAIRDAVAKVNELTASAMGGLGDALGGLLP